MTGAEWHQAFQNKAHIEMISGKRWTCATVTRLRISDHPMRQSRAIVQWGYPYSGETPAVAWKAWRASNAGFD